MDFFVIFGLVSAGIVAGYMWRDFMLVRGLIKRLEQQAKNATTEPTVSVHQQDQETESQIYNGMNLIHEIIDERHYFYDEADSTFVCQGSTLQDAAAAYSKRQGDDYVGMFSHYESNKQYFFLQGQVHESSEPTKSV